MKAMTSISTSQPSATVLLISTMALAGRAVAETLTLPLTVVSALVDLGRNSGRKPCESKP